MDKLAVLSEIKEFLDGYNEDLKYMVHVECDPNINIAECIIREPGKELEIRRVGYVPFIYIKDLSQFDLKLYQNNSDIYESKLIQYGITITPLKTGNQKRLKNGYCFKISSSKSNNAITNFLKEGGIYPYYALRDINGNEVKDSKGEKIFPYKDMFYSPRIVEQFFISTRSRLFKGFEEYKDVHKVTFDIETTGLRYQKSRVFAIGVRDNRNFETILEVDKIEDDESEIKLIESFFNLIIYLNPAIISGYNSEDFDFDFILGRARELKMNLSQIVTTLKRDVQLKRRPNVSLKYGGTTEKFTATEIWGISVTDIIHATKKTAALNSEIKENKLKYIAKFEKIAKPNRTYIPGEDGAIGNYYNENKVFVINDINEYIIIPDEYQEVADKMLNLQSKRSKLSTEEYRGARDKYFDNNVSFLDWLKAEALPKNMIKFISGKDLVKQYLLDDLWETEQVDELYNQSSFMLAKIVPTTYQRITTMGTAAIWNLLLTAWSYDNDIAIPFSEKKEGFSGGLVRCFSVGYDERIIKIDYASLYPMLQLTWKIFPMFDITGVIHKMLLYLTTTRNIYKKLANNDRLNTDELALLKQIDIDVYVRLLNNNITDIDRARFKIKQLPIKILNNSLFGALGSGVSFNWSDNVCAARITCNGRLMLRKAITWFNKFNCKPLMAVTDGINFKIPNKTTIRVTNDNITEEIFEAPIEEMWQYNGKVGMSALIEKYNSEEMLPPYMSVDDDGTYISSLNVSRINYATLEFTKDKKTGEDKEKIKLTGNTLKSKVKSEYIQDFMNKGFELILHGNGKEFVDYYYDYVDTLQFCQIPLKKIATKSRIKMTISAYNKRGKDKNGREKAKQAHMELLIQMREKIAKELFEKHKDEFDLSKIKNINNIDTILKLVSDYMPPELALDSVVYQVNTGFLKSHGNSQSIIDPKTNEKRYASVLISADDLRENPNILGTYNVARYLGNFNKSIKPLLIGFDDNVQKTILSKMKKTKVKDEFGNIKTEVSLSKTEYKSEELVLKSFSKDTIEEAVYLEEKEVEFWNKTGYDPRKVWDGFKIHDEDKIYYEIYDSALKYLNDLMIKNNKPLIKSINDNYEKNDLVLIKDDHQYQLGVYNGVYVKIIKENIENIPKTDIELKLEKEKAELEEKLKQLEINAVESEKEKELKTLIEKRNLYFVKFKREFDIPSDMTLETFIAEDDEFEDMFNNYMDDMELVDNYSSEKDVDLDDI